MSKTTKKDDYIKILIEDKFNSEVSEDDLMMLNSMSTEQLRLMVVGGDDLDEFEEE